jgi:uncharacterized DUF497 family protein
MSGLSFEWDSPKASTNAAKHGITFEEARTVFYDDDALLIPDPDRLQHEDRLIIVGRSAESQMLVAVHCFRKEGSSIRNILARRAGTKEQNPYWQKHK